MYSWIMLQRKNAYKCNCITENSLYLQHDSDLNHIIQSSYKTTAVEKMN